jgi:hypothetical protein
VEAGRASWHRRQLGAAVRDLPPKAARVLAELNWTCTPPPDPVLPDNDKAFSTW